MALIKETDQLKFDEQPDYDLYIRKLMTLLKKEND